MDESQRRCASQALALCLLCVAGCSAPHSRTPVSPSVTLVETQAEAPVVTPVETPVSNLTLAYDVGQADTYCFSAESTRSVRLEGLRPDDKSLGAFDSAITGWLFDITWTQTVQAVDPNGQAFLLIEIQGLDYKGYRMGELAVDYDSTVSPNAATALADLIGLSYRIRMDAKGQVVQVWDAEEAKAQLGKGKPQLDIAQGLLSEKMVRARHRIKPLNMAPDQSVKDQTWTASESFAFGRLGGKTFEKTYVCQAVDAAASRVEIRMADFKSVDKSVSSVNTPSLPFTSEDQFTGALTLDTRTGQVKMYRESLEIHWAFVDPTSRADAQPRKGHMTARQACLLERKESSQ